MAHLLQIKLKLTISKFKGSQIQVHSAKMQARWQWISKKQLYIHVHVGTTCSSLRALYTRTLPTKTGHSCSVHNFKLGFLITLHTHTHERQSYQAVPARAHKRRIEHPTSPRYCPGLNPSALLKTEQGLCVTSHTYMYLLQTH